MSCFLWENEFAFGQTVKFSIKIFNSVGMRSTSVSKKTDTGVVLPFYWHVSDWWLNNHCLEMTETTDCENWRHLLFLGKTLSSLLDGLTYERAIKM